MLVLPSDEEADEATEQLELPPPPPPPPPTPMAAESVEQTGEVAGDELAKLWPDESPSLLCDGDMGPPRCREPCAVAAASDAATDDGLAARRELGRTWPKMAK